MNQLALFDPTGEATREAARWSSTRHEVTPIVKWAGGKTGVMAQLLPLLPDGIGQRRHIEPFCGGAAMFFARRPANAVLCDTNPHLIRTYTMVRDCTEAVLEQLQVIAAAHTEDADATYARERDAHNAGTGAPVTRAARFIYLNKSCFNGLYRVNKRGEFNVPPGRYEKPRIVDEENLRAAAALLAHADLSVQSYEQTADICVEGDFIFADPPYAPASTTANFTAYGRDGFTDADQERLAAVFKQLDRRGCKLMLSNSDVPLIRDLYRRYRIDTISATRSINSKADKRGAVREVVVRNY